MIQCDLKGKILKSSFLYFFQRCVTHFCGTGHIEAGLTPGLPFTLGQSLSEPH